MFQRDWNGQPDLQDDLMRDLSSKKARLVERYSRIEGNIDSMKDKISQIRQKIEDLKNLKATKCPERKVKGFLNSYFTLFSVCVKMVTVGVRTKRSVSARSPIL